MKDGNVGSNILIPGAGVGLRSATARRGVRPDVGPLHQANRLTPVTFRTDPLR